MYYTDVQYWHGFSIDDLLRDTDSEMEDNTGSQRPKKVARRKLDRGKKGAGGAAWLKEGGDEDIVDFLDPSVSKKVLGIVHSFYILSEIAKKYAC